MLGSLHRWVALLLAAWVFGAAAAGTDEDAIALQLRLVDAIAKAAEPAAAQHKQVLETVEKIASQTLASAESTSAHVHGLATAFAGALGALVALAGAVGWGGFVMLRRRLERSAQAQVATAISTALTGIERRMGDVQRDMDAGLGALKQRMELAERDLKAQAEARMMETISRIGAISLGIIQYLQDKEPVVRDWRAAPQQPLARDRIAGLLMRLDTIASEASATTADRVTNWTHTERAVLCYLVHDFELAHAHQVLACEGVEPGDYRFLDRYQNLACMAFKVFQLFGSAAALGNAERALSLLEAAVTPTQADALIREPDLQAFFVLYPVRLQALKARTNATP